MCYGLEKKEKTLNCKQYCKNSDIFSLKWNPRLQKYKQTAAMKQNNKSMQTAKITAQKMANGTNEEYGNNWHILRKASDLLSNNGTFYTAFLCPFWI